MTWFPRLSLSVGLVLAAIAAAPPQETSTEDDDDRSPVRDFRTAPPVAQRAAIRLLATAHGNANAVLFVQFAPGEPAPRVITLRLEQERLVLRDDGNPPDERAGDGIHSGYVRVDVEQLQRIQQSMVRSRELPLFVGRELAAQVVVREDQGQQFRSAAEALERIPVLPLRENKEGQRISEFQGIASLTLPVSIPFRPDVFDPIFPVVDPTDVNVGSALVITDDAVINDPARTINPCTGVGTPMGQWTFGHLMEQLANEPKTGISPSEFVRTWLKQWELGQIINGLGVPATDKGPTGVTAKLTKPWLAASGGTKLDLSKAPFRLRAIVNRVDLRQNVVYGGGSAGEGRFVFELVDIASGCSESHGSMMVIFEFGIQRPNCVAVKAWAQQWQDLSTNPVGSKAYNAALEAITVQFTEAGTNPSRLPNQSSLNQLRTNDDTFPSAPENWELREFRLASEGSDVGQLREATVKQTPDDRFNHTATLASYIKSQSGAILKDRHEVPLEFPAGPFARSFLGGYAPLMKRTWDGPLPQPSASLSGTPNLRFHFSVNTCNGCHDHETGTFTHVHPGGGLSGFMTGTDVLDPAGEGVTRHFNDQLRRQESMAQLLFQPCVFQVFFSPLRMVH